ncbi:hypothetical protein [Rubrivirga sp.]|uniref:hypothetical protein n=1 Tax=Rubrivirga sp. TaxID=1885344 RepID=UPI003C73E655
MPSRTPSSPHDPVLRHTYGGQLEASAEAFLVSAFDRASGALSSEAEPPGVLVSAAMHILTRASWKQPTDEQVKASVYLGEKTGPRAPSAEPRRIA